MPLDPIAQKMIDDSRASGRPNAHLLPVETARQNFEDTFAALTKPEIHRIVDVEIPTRDGETIRGRLYLPSEATRPAAHGVLPRRRLAARQRRLPRRHHPVAGDDVRQCRAVGRLPPRSRLPLPHRRPRRDRRPRMGDRRRCPAAGRHLPRRRRRRQRRRQPRRRGGDCMCATPAKCVCATNCSSTQSPPVTSTADSTTSTRESCSSATRCSGTRTTTCPPPTSRRTRGWTSCPPI